MLVFVSFSYLYSEKELSYQQKQSYGEFNTAVKDNNINKVKTLLKSTSANETNQFGFAPLHVAAAQGNLAMVQLLIEEGADVNVRTKNKSKSTPLGEATGAGKLAVVKLLVEKGANINAILGYGFTALHNAAGEGYLDIVKYLIENDADPDGGVEVPQCRWVGSFV